jgi:hypothetical protein
MTIASPANLERLLGRQQAHDARYHREIERLARGPRVQHLALHIAKYVGRLAASVGAPAKDHIQTLADCGIICLSACNALGLLSREIATSMRKQPTFSTAPGIENSPIQSLALRLAIHAGALAKACEALDHLERIDYATELREAILSVLAVLLWFCEEQGIDLDAAIDARWKNIERERLP